MGINNKKIFSATLVLSLCYTGAAFATSNFSYTQEHMGPVNQSPAYESPMYPMDNVLKGNVVMVPAGTSLKAAVTSTISSETANQGDQIVMSLNSDFYYNNKLIAPAGSTVVGTVIEASKAKHGSMNGKLCVRFNMINTPTGNQIPISAVIRTDDGTGVLLGGTKMDVTKEYVKDMAIGSAAGALSGVVFGALAGGDKLGRGAALGTAVGAGGGLVKSVIDKGKDVEIPYGASVDLVFTQPVTVSVPAYHFEN